MSFVNGLIKETNTAQVFCGIEYRSFVTSWIRPFHFPHPSVSTFDGVIMSSNLHMENIADPRSLRVILSLADIKKRITLRKWHRGNRVSKHFPSLIDRVSNRKIRQSLGFPSANNQWYGVITFCTVFDGAMKLGSKLLNTCGKRINIPVKTIWQRINLYWLSGRKKSANQSFKSEKCRLILPPIIKWLSF